MNKFLVVSKQPGLVTVSIWMSLCLSICAPIIGTV